MSESTVIRANGAHLRFPAVQLFARSVATVGHVSVWWVVLFLTSLVSLEANAAIYRCTTPGKPDTYQDSPCQKDAVQSDVSGRVVPSDPLTGEFSGKILSPKPKPDEEGQRMRFRITRNGEQYHATVWTPDKGWQPIQTTLGRCSQEDLKEVLGEHWSDFDPVGVCAHGLLFIHSRRGKAMPEFGNSGYGAFIAYPWSGLTLELEKIS